LGELKPLPPGSKIEVEIHIILPDRKLPISGSTILTSETTKPILFASAGDPVQRGAYEVLATIWPQSLDK